MIKNRLLSILLTLLLLASPAFAALNLEGARELAYKYIEKELGLQQADLTLQTEHQDSQGGYFTFIFQMKEAGDSNGQIFLQLDGRGAVHDFRPPVPAWEIALARRLNQTRGLLNQGLDMEGLANLSAEFAQDQELLAQLLARQEADGKQLGSSQGIARMLLIPLRLPQENEADVQMAAQTARAAILALPDWNQQKLDQYPLLLSFCYDAKELGLPVYHFVFAQKPHPEEAAMEAYERSYLQPLNELFGGGQFAAPHYISVLVDAKSGTLTGAPLVMYHGPDYLAPWLLVK